MHYHTIIRISTGKSKHSSALTNIYIRIYFEAFCVDGQNVFSSKNDQHPQTFVGFVNMAVEMFKSLFRI